MFLHQMSHGVLAERVAALYLLHFRLKSGTKEIPYYVRNVIQLCYMQMLVGKLFLAEKVNDFMPQEQDKIIEMTQSENLHFLQPLFPMLTMVALFRLCSDAREPDQCQ